MEWVDALHETPDLCGEIEVLDYRAVFIGRYSCVYKGKMKKTRELVAIKVMNTLRGTGLSTMRRKIERERKTWRSLQHPNILPLYGFADDHRLFTPFGAFISPWRSRGDLGEFLINEGENTPLKVRLQLWHGVVAGVQHLHSHQPLLVHGDLKPGNVLIDDDGNAQLCDFGLVRVYLNEGHSGMTTASPFCGTERYLAWELLLADEDAVPTTASDIYATGCIGLEALFLEKPYSRHRTNLRRNMMSDMKLGKPPAIRPIDLVGHLDSLWNILSRCWAHDPLFRPQASVLSVHVADILSTVHSEGRRLSSGNEPQRQFEPSPPLTPSNNNKRTDGSFETLVDNTGVPRSTPSTSKTGDTLVNGTNLASTFGILSVFPRSNRRAKPDVVVNGADCMNVDQVSSGPGTLEEGRILSSSLAPIGAVNATAPTHATFKAPYSSLLHVDARSHPEQYVSTERQANKGSAFTFRGMPVHVPRLAQLKTSALWHPSTTEILSYPASEVLAAECRSYSHPRHSTAAPTPARCSQLNAPATLGYGHDNERTKPDESRDLSFVHTTPHSTAHYSSADLYSPFNTTNFKFDPVYFEGIITGTDPYHSYVCRRSTRDAWQPPPPQPTPNFTGIPLASQKQQDYLYCGAADGTGYKGNLQGRPPPWINQPPAIGQIHSRIPKRYGNSGQPSVAQPPASTVQFSAHSWGQEQDPPQMNGVARGQSMLNSGVSGSGIHVDALQSQQFGNQGLLSKLIGRKDTGNLGINATPPVLKSSAPPTKAVPTVLSTLTSSMQRPPYLGIRLRRRRVACAAPYAAGPQNLTGLAAPPVAAVTEPSTSHIPAKDEPWNQGIISPIELHSPHRMASQGQVGVDRPGGGSMGSPSDHRRQLLFSAPSLWPTPEFPSPDQRRQGSPSSPLFESTNLAQQNPHHASIGPSNISSASGAHGATKGAESGIRFKRKKRVQNYIDYDDEVPEDATMVCSIHDEDPPMTARTRLQIMNGASNHNGPKTTPTYDSAPPPKKTTASEDAPLLPPKRSLMTPGGLPQSRSGGYVLGVEGRSPFKESERPRVSFGKSQSSSQIRKDTEEDLDIPIIPNDEQDTGRDQNCYSSIDPLDEKAEHWEPTIWTRLSRTYNEDDVAILPPPRALARLSRASLFRRLGSSTSSRSNLSLVDQFGNNNHQTGAKADSRNTGSMYELASPVPPSWLRSGHLPSSATRRGTGQAERPRPSDACPSIFANSSDSGIWLDGYTASLPAPTAAAPASQGPEEQRATCSICYVTIPSRNLERHRMSRHPNHVEVLSQVEDARSFGTTSVARRVDH